jgi:hypothetical protein
MNTLYLTDEQLIWLGQAFLASATDIKIAIDPKGKFEQQLEDQGAFDDEESWIEAAE